MSARKQAKGKLGATWQEGGVCEFLVWAPHAEKVEVHVTAPTEKTAAMESGERGYFRARVKGIEPGARYKYRLDENHEFPDPASRCQPQGVHGPSQVVRTDFMWSDSAWSGLELNRYVLYELHVGTFTREGTFDAVIPRLAALKELGITAIEVMPVAQFPGSRNWGYDGVFPFAVQNSYGGPEGLKRLVDACHALDLAAVLDVVYNHLGPEGNYFSKFGPYFTDFYHTPWGEAINFSREGSDEVRRYFVENAVYWMEEFHFDALRLDAVHAIVDPLSQPFLSDLSRAAAKHSKKSGRPAYLIAESSQNDPRLLTPIAKNGVGLDAVWNDDFHHSLHTLLTGELSGYYADFGAMELFAKAYAEGFAYTGEYSKYRGRRQGSSSTKLPAERFVVYAQNHDQVGNRLLGDRLSAVVSAEAQKLASALVILSPYLPMLFMGEEYGETAPFLYFVSHSDRGLIEAVRKGRREEFAEFAWEGELPDPQSEETFARSRLHWELRDQKQHRQLLEWNRELFRLRRENEVLSRLDKKRMELTTIGSTRTLCVRRWNGGRQILCLFHFSTETGKADVALPKGEWKRLLDSTETRWGGPGSTVPEWVDSPGEYSFKLNPHAAVVYQPTSAKIEEG